MLMLMLMLMLMYMVHVKFVNSRKSVEWLVYKHLETTELVVLIQVYGIAGNFCGVLIFVIFVINLLVTKFSNHENYKRLTRIDPMHTTLRTHKLTVTNIENREYYF